TFRRNPFGGGYSVACGLHYLIDYVESLRFEEGDLTYLASLKGNDGKALFEAGFLAHLADMQWRVNVDGAPEGAGGCPHEPLVRVSGPILQCQILETPLLNVVNFQ